MTGFEPVPVESEMAILSAVPQLCQSDTPILYAFSNIASAPLIVIYFCIRIYNLPNYN